MVLHKLEGMTSNDYLNVLMYIPVCFVSSFSFKSTSIVHFVVITCITLYSVSLYIYYDYTLSVSGSLHLLYVRKDQPFCLEDLECFD